MESRKEINDIIELFEENVGAVQNAYGSAYHSLSLLKELPDKPSQEQVVVFNRSLNVMKAAMVAMLATFEKNQSRLDYLTSKN